ncbi:MAG TPA: DUF3810 domain-containing protein [Clostridiaceae bacterium]|nr:DUF3810 domain-containing protein [Clostridiaceae bacterium]
MKRRKEKKRRLNEIQQPDLFAASVALGIALFIVLVLFVLREAAFKYALIADIYSKKIFQPLAKIWSSLTNLIPFSLTELFVVGGSLALIVLAIRGIVRFIRHPAWRWQRLLKTVLIVLTIALYALSLFFTFHGIHYARSPLAESLGLVVKERPADELENATIAFARAAGEVREGLPEDKNGVLMIDSTRDLFKDSYRGWEKAGEVFPALKSSVRPIPKNVILSRYWSYTHIVGMYMPLFVEVNVNTDQPDYGIPAMTAHEIAHARGFAREDDANLAAYISCLYHPDPVWRYSGLLSAWKQLSDKLYAEDYERWSNAYAHITPAIARDLESEREYWEAFETPIATFSSAVNDAYLKANKEDAGVKTYGQVVDLLLAYIEMVGAP